MRRVIVVGRTASASGKYSLDDLPGSSGRLDVLLRCVRAALLTSHGSRRDVVVYLVLQRGPRVVRIGGEELKFVRPDERSLATLVQKLLLRHDPAEKSLVEQKPGLGVASGGLDWVLSDLRGARVNELPRGDPIPLLTPCLSL